MSDWCPVAQLDVIDPLYPSPRLSGAQFAVTLSVSTLIFMRRVRVTVTNHPFVSHLVRLSDAQWIKVLKWAGFAFAHACRLVSNTYEYRYDLRICLSVCLCSCLALCLSWGDIVVITGFLLEVKVETDRNRAPKHFSPLKITVSLNLLREEIPRILEMYERFNRITYICKNIMGTYELLSPHIYNLTLFLFFYIPG